MLINIKKKKKIVIKYYYETPILLINSLFYLIATHTHAKNKRFSRTKIFLFEVNLITKIKEECKEYFCATKY